MLERAGGTTKHRGVVTQVDSLADKRRGDPDGRWTRIYRTSLGRGESSTSEAQPLGAIKGLEIRKDRGVDEERLSELVRLAVREEVHRSFAEIAAHLHSFFNGNRADISEKRRAAAHARWRKEKGHGVDAKDAVASVARRKRSSSVIPEVPAEQVFICIPVIGGQEYPIAKDLVAKLEGLYPAVDVPQTLREIAGWNMANPANRKTPGGMMSHITRWMQREQNRG